MLGALSEHPRTHSNWQHRNYAPDSNAVTPNISTTSKSRAAAAVHQHFALHSNISMQQTNTSLHPPGLGFRV
eukprot:2297582-Rhodomonas_salina.1